MVFIHDDVVDDLDAIGRRLPLAAQRIRATLEHLVEDSWLQSLLLDHGYGEEDDAEIDVKRWQALWRQGIDLWRVKFHDLSDHGLHYRFIYYYDRQERDFYVLAVISRNGLDYDDPDDPTRQRVLRRCHELFGTP